MIDFNDSANTQLNALEHALCEKKSYTYLKSLLGNFTVDEQPTGRQLQRTVRCLYPLFLKSLSDITGAERSVYYRAEQWFHQILFDKDYDSKQWIKSSLKKHLEKQGSLKNFLELDPALESSEPKKALQHIFQHYQYLPEITIPWGGDEAYHQLTPYFDWICSQLVEQPAYHYKISWEVLVGAQPPIKAAFQQWWQTLESQSLVEPGFSQHIVLAQQWYLRCENLSSLTTQEFYQLIKLLDSSNPILRGIAARCIGATYADWLDEDEFRGDNEIPIVEMMGLIYQKQKDGHNVAGGFINGVSVDGSIRELEQHRLLLAKAFDVKAWVLTIASTCPESEPYIPGSQAFWFYVHEYLDSDPKAVQVLIDHQRYWLAMMCASEYHEAYDVMKPLLESLINFAPQAVADSCKDYMAIMENK